MVDFHFMLVVAVGVSLFQIPELQEGITAPIALLMTPLILLERFAKHY